MRKRSIKFTYMIGARRLYNTFQAETIAKQMQDHFQVKDGTTAKLRMKFCDFTNKAEKTAMIAGAEQEEIKVINGMMKSKSKAKEIEMLENKIMKVNKTKMSNLRD